LVLIGIVDFKPTYLIFERVISVNLSILTSAAPLSVVLSLFSKEKKGKRGRSGGQD